MSEVAANNVQAPICMPNLIIWFKRVVDKNDSDEWLLDRITISTPNYFQDTKINDRKPASQRFADDVWAFLASYLPASTDEGVRSNQRACLEASNYLFHGVAAVGKRAAEGVQRAFITINNFLGSPKEMFKNNSFPDLLSDLECHLSARTLSDVIIPALNLVASASGPTIRSAEAKVAAFVERLEANKRDIEFYAELISRFVASRDTGMNKGSITTAADTYRNQIDTRALASESAEPDRAQL